MPHASIPWTPKRRGKPPGERFRKPFILFVNGTLMHDQELQANLEGTNFLGEVRTAPRYHPYSIRDRHSAMFEVDDQGVSVRGELYELTEETWERVDVNEPPNLYRGSVELGDGRRVDGMPYPCRLAEGRHRDISDLGDWREYRRRLDADR